MEIVRLFGSIKWITRDICEKYAEVFELGKFTQFRVLILHMNFNNLMKISIFGHSARSDHDNDFLITFLTTYYFTFHGISMMYRQRTKPHNSNEIGTTEYMEQFGSQEMRDLYIMSWRLLCVLVHTENRSFPIHKRKLSLFNFFAVFEFRHKKCVKY